LGNDSALAVSTTAVGIGTSSPAGKLHISGDGAAANLIRLQNTGAGTNGFFDISVTSTEAQVIANYSTTAIPMLFLTGAAERLRITSAGNVGIGTSSPNVGIRGTGTPCCKVLPLEIMDVRQRRHTGRLLQSWTLIKPINREITILFV
jgi:hypothetical protein